MFKKQVFMRNQVNNCIATIMAEDKPRYVRQLEEFLVGALFVTIFIIGASF